MLTPEDENKLNTLVTVINDYKKTNNYPRISSYHIEWLASTCAKLNAQAKIDKETITHLENAVEDLVKDGRVF